MPTFRSMSAAFCSSLDKKAGYEKSAAKGKVIVETQKPAPRLKAAWAWLVSCFAK